MLLGEKISRKFFRASPVDFNLLSGTKKWRRSLIGAVRPRTVEAAHGTIQRFVFLRVGATFFEDIELARPVEFFDLLGSVDFDLEGDFVSL